MVIRTNTAYHSPRNLIPMNWGSAGAAWVGAAAGVNPFSVTSQDPNTNKFPIQYATGRAGIDGNFTVAVTTGFSPSINLIVWEWNRAANAWFRLGANTGTYEITLDSTYVLSTFQVSENAYVLIQSSAAVTGNAYMDGMIDFQNSGVPGQPEEGI